MYSVAVNHESRIFKQARPNGQDVDLLRRDACYSLITFIVAPFCRKCNGFGKNLFPHQILPHIDGAGNEDNQAFDDVLHIRVDAQKGQTHEDDS